MDIDFLKYIIGLAIIVIGYFLKDVFGRFNKLNEKVDLTVGKYREEHGKLKGRVELIEQKVPSEIANLEKIMDLRLSSFEKRFDNIEHSINKIFEFISDENKK